MTERERGIWAFQANPRVYDIEAAVRSLLVDTWTIAKSDVRLGDLAIIWKAKGSDTERGIVSFGLVVSEPFESEDMMNPYWREAHPKQERQARVRVRYVTPPEAPFWESAHPWLGDLSVSRGQQTVFHVAPQDWARAVSLTGSEEHRAWLQYAYPSEGDDWIPAEFELVTRAYFEMMEKELMGERYVKAEVRRRLRQAIPHRTDSAIEYRFQNISAVLRDIDEPWLPGYAPAENGGPKLVPYVLAALRNQTAREPAPAPELREVRVPQVKPAVPARGREAEAKAVLRDHEALARTKREVGRRGEEMVAEHERARLRAAKRPDLAARVEIVAVTQGDGLGYDVKSFEPDGTELAIEVKATRGPPETPFFLTRRELERSVEPGPEYRLFRVARLDEAPEFFVLKGPLDGVLALEPEAFRARLKPW